MFKNRSHIINIPHGFNIFSVGIISENRYAFWQNCAVASGYRNLCCDASDINDNKNAIKTPYNLSKLADYIILPYTLLGFIIVKLKCTQ